MIPKNLLFSSYFAILEDFKKKLFLRNSVQAEKKGKNNSNNLFTKLAVLLRKRNRILLQLSDHFKNVLS